MALGTRSTLYTHLLDLVISVIPLPKLKELKHPVSPYKGSLASVTLRQWSSASYV